MPEETLRWPVQRIKLVGKRLSGYLLDAPLQPVNEDDIPFIPDIDLVRLRSWPFFLLFKMPETRSFKVDATGIPTCLFTPVVTIDSQPGIDG